MGTRLLLLISWVNALALVGGTLAQSSTTNAELIRRLGSDNFAEREAAAQELMCRPNAKIDLTEALKSRDKEVARRAQAVLNELERRKRDRVLSASRRLAAATRIDSLVDALTSEYGQPMDPGCWEAVHDTVRRLLEKERRQFGKGSGPRNAAPRSIGMAHDKVLMARSSRWVVDTPRVAADSLEKGPLDPPAFMLIRTGEIDYGRRLAVVAAICAGAVRVEIFGGILFTNGDVSASSIISGSVVVADGDVSAPMITHSLVIATGTVKATRVGESTILCGQRAEFKESPKNSIVLCAGPVLSPPVVPGNLIKHNESEALSWVDFFDPSQAGVHGKLVKDGFHVISVEQGKPFARAGVRGGDLLVAVAGRPVMSIAGFRRTLRKALAAEERFAIQLRRGEEVREVTISRLD